MPYHSDKRWFKGLKEVAFLFILSLQLNTFQAQVVAQGESYKLSIEKLIDKEHYKKAFKNLDGIIAVDPENLWARRTRAELNVFLAREKEAREDLENLFGIDEEYISTYLVYAKLMDLKFRTDSALYYISKGLELSPDSSDIEEFYGLQGRILMDLKRFEEAEESLYTAAKCPLVSMETMKNLARVLVENGKMNEASYVLRGSMDVFGADFEFLVNNGYVCNELGLYDEAIFYLERALFQEPENPYALSNIALSYLHIGQLEKASEFVGRSIRNDPDNSFAYRVKGEYFIALGDNTKSCKEFNRALQLGYYIEHEKDDIDNLMASTCGTR
ncbi:MAG: tetratricopeptide repeat protein [Flavobacteriales bacterium]|nr:tetratricopeptide repeat protein [Flavobacteriales bacterium]